MLVNNIHLAEIHSPKQTIKARVELYSGSTLKAVCNCADTLADFKIERTGAAKFFGFGISKKITARLIDIKRELDITTDNTIEAAFGVNGDFIYPFPNFYIAEVERDELDNTITVVGYDALYRANSHTVSELNLAAPYSLEDFVIACAQLLNIPLVIDSVAKPSFATLYPSSANFDGSESIRSALDAIAEATQTIYYIDSNWDLYFKRINQNGASVEVIGKNDYFTLETKEALTLTGITKTTELEDGVTAAEERGSDYGVMQYIRNNPFWDLRDDVGDLLDVALANVGGTVITPFECEWSGNYLLEIGDKIALIAEDDTYIYAYILDDVITFDGTLTQVSKWEFDNNKAETVENPTSLGDALYKTYAKIDKANRRIELVASETTENTNNIARLDITTETISASVKKNEDSIASLRIDADSLATEVKKIEPLQESVNELTGEIETTKTELRSEFKQTASEAVYTFEKKVETNGVTKVSGTGYRFDIDGLTINKTDAPTQTTITENGMRISATDWDNTELLTVNNQGVKAKDLHATSWLIIGRNSRLEDYGASRTACFWIGD